MKVITDQECREYAEGWNACNEGRLRLANPYSALAYAGEQYRVWGKGYDDCQFAWDDCGSIPVNKMIYTGMPSAINGGLTQTEN